MGMYTELYLTVELKEKTPQEIINILTVICDGLRFEEGPNYGDPLKTTLLTKEELPEDLQGTFSSSECWILARSSSYYFAGDPLSSLRYDRISRSYHLTLRGDIKDYGNEIREFLNWLQPHVEVRGYAGHIRYEEDYAPTLIFFRDSGMQLISATPIVPLDWEEEESDDK